MSTWRRNESKEDMSLDSQSIAVVCYKARYYERSKRTQRIKKRKGGQWRAIWWEGDKGSRLDRYDIGRDISIYKFVKSKW